MLGLNRHTNSSSKFKTKTFGKCKLSEQRNIDWSETPKLSNPSRDTRIPVPLWKRRLAMDLPLVVRVVQDHKFAVAKVENVQQLLWHSSLAVIRAYRAMVSQQADLRCKISIPDNGIAQNGIATCHLAFTKNYHRRTAKNMKTHYPFPALSASWATCWSTSFAW